MSQVGKGTLKERALLCDTGTSCEMELNKANLNQAVTLPYLREIARHLQEKESLKLERARQRRIERQQKEEAEGKLLSEALSKLKENGKNRVNHFEVAEIQTALVPVGSRDRPVHTDDTKPHQKLSAKGSNSSRGSDNGNSMGEGTVVQLPRPAEGGRLECDRIIMDDGTAIQFFDENDDSGVREKAHRRSRERQDENHRSGFFVTLCSSWRNGCPVYSGCYRTRLGSTGRLRRHIILRWGNRNVVTRDTRKDASRLRRKGKRRRWKGDFVGAKARIRRLHFNCLAEQYKLNADFLLFFRSC
ncbi:uncharacterized protein [Montipora capricornis]|uniref:uncharacterized protein n=1 Tax=Montipora capricornis TaxID=246305 RepID=UPI0035F1E462